MTATKRGYAESVQNVAIAMTAFGEAQLDAKFVQNLQSLSYDVPNVQLDGVGTAPGYANFTIRGLGINSTIPSIDPTVGVFVDGMYLGINAGVVLDNFDLEGVEVLRGPQGLLFGRNVTGGAVVMRTTLPRFTFGANAKVSVETGLKKTVSGMVTGPLIDDVLAAKLAVYYSDDDGWFRNRFDGRSFGKSRDLIIRPALSFKGGDDFRMDICAATQAPIAPNAAGVTAKTLAGGRYAVLRHTGSDDTLGQSVATLYVEWLPASGEEPRDAPLLFQRVRFYPDVPEHEAITDILLPLK